MVHAHNGTGFGHIKKKKKSSHTRYNMPAPADIMLRDGARCERPQILLCDSIRTKHPKHTNPHTALHLPTLCYTPTPHPSHPCTQCTNSGLSSFPVARSEQIWGGGLEGGGSSLTQALPPHIIIGDRIEYVGVQISRAVHLDIS